MAFHMFIQAASTVRIYTAYFAYQRLLSDMRPLVLNQVLLLLEAFSTVWPITDILLRILMHTTEMFAKIPREPKPFSTLLALERSLTSVAPDMLFQLRLECIALFAYRAFETVLC